MKIRLALAAAIVLTCPIALVAAGCSTSSVHPPTYGDCLTEGVCKEIPPTSSVAVTPDAGSDAKSTTDGGADAAARADADAAAPTPPRDAGAEGG